MARAARQPRTGEADKPLYVVWETTMRCDHACAHCGSRAAKPRPRELSTAELFGVVDTLLTMGTREVTLIGGEAYLRPDCEEHIRYMADRGLRVTMQSGGQGLTQARCEALAEAGLAAVGVSIDGPEAVHDLQRASPGSYRAAIAALGHVRAAGMQSASNMQVNALTHPHLRAHYEQMQALEVSAWRLQITVPMGRAADRPGWLLAPWRVLEVIDTLADLQHNAIARALAQGLPATRAMNVQLGNNLGYFGPHEALLRAPPGRPPAHYQGCLSGRYTLGIESNGDVKGCPSLPTHPYTGGNLLDEDLREVWAHTPELNFVQERTPEELHGFCRGCYYAPVCMAGCSWTSHCTLGRRGDQPYCYHRAATLRAEGLRERLEQIEVPEGLPYDYGRFKLVREPWPT